jgi:hypothetical protein
MVRAALAKGGIEDPDPWMSCSQCGQTFPHSGAVFEAMSDAWFQKTRGLPESHVARSLSSLMKASVLRSMGKEDEAAALRAESDQGFQNYMGSDQNPVAKLDDSVIDLLCTGRYAEAVPLLQAHHKILEELVTEASGCGTDESEEDGFSRRLTVKTAVGNLMMNKLHLGVCLSRLSAEAGVWAHPGVPVPLQQYTDALKLLREVVAIRTRNLGKEHEDTYAAKYALAECLAMQGVGAPVEAEAMAILEEVVAGLAELEKVGRLPSFMLGHPADLLREMKSVTAR